MITDIMLQTSVESLPTFPTVCSELQQALTNCDANSREIEAIIKKDPSITTMVLRMVNSAYYALPRSIDNLNHAIKLLGKERICDAAFMSGFEKVLPETLTGYCISRESFFNHSIAVAVLSEEFASNIDRIDNKSVSFFTAGLLHDIGKLVISTYLDEHIDETINEINKQNKDFIAAETSILGANHTEAGALIAHKWNLPDSIITAIKYHHHPSSCAGILQDLAYIVHLADGLAHSAGYGTDIGELDRQIDENCIEILKIDQDILERVLIGSVEKIESLLTQNSPKGSTK